MRYFAIIFLLLPLYSPGQTIPPGTAHIKKCVATSYKDNGDTLQFKEVFTYYDSAWNVLVNTNTLQSALKQGYSDVTICDTPVRKEIVSIKPDGDTLDHFVYLYDLHGNRTHYFQIRKGDTLNNQKRVYDQNNNNTELYNWENGKYVLFMKFEYDSRGNTTSQRQFDSQGNIVTEERFEKNYKTGSEKYYRSYKGGKFQLRTVSETNGLIKTTKFYCDQNGINYGIMLLRYKGGYSIEERDENGNLLRLESYNKEKNLITSVYITFTDYP
jgi:hypothetical protein